MRTNAESLVLLLALSLQLVACSEGKSAIPTRMNDDDDDTASGGNPGSGGNRNDDDDGEGGQSSGGGGESNGGMSQGGAGSGGTSTAGSGGMSNADPDPVVSGNLFENPNFDEDPSSAGWSGALGSYFAENAMLSWYEMGSAQISVGTRETEDYAGWQAQLKQQLEYPVAGSYSMRFDVRALSGTKEVVLLMQREGGDFENFGVAACEVGTSFVTCTVSGEIPAGEPLVNFAVHGGAEPVDFLVDRAVLLLDAASDAGLPDPSDAGSEESGDAGASDAGSDPNPETDASLLNLFVNASFDANFDGWDYYAPGGAVSWSESEGA
jgi:hypothetical protein